MDPELDKGRYRENTRLYRYKRNGIKEEERHREWRQRTVGRQKKTENDMKEHSISKKNPGQVEKKKHNTFKDG